MTTDVVTKDDAAVYCEATFNYMGTGPLLMPVLDGRKVQPTFDEEGFQLIEHRSEIGDWHDQEDVDTVHAREVADLARSFTRCDATVVYPSILRNPASAAQTPDYAPVELVHSDYSEDYRAMVSDPSRRYSEYIGPLLEQEGLTAADLASASRLMVFQLWRNTGPVEADRPLALCDVRGIGADRLQRFLVPQYGGLNLEFETTLFAGPRHGATDRWITFPRMERHEAIVFRTYDSDRAREGGAFWTPHSAFTDPSVPATAEHRRASVEMRVLCVWR
jgi:hypothetical protein